VSARQRFAELVADFSRLAPDRIRVYVAATVSSMAERRAFEERTAGAMHSVLCDDAARTVVRAELLRESYRRATERASSEASGPHVVAKIRLVQRTG